MFRAANAGLTTMCNLRVLPDSNLSEYRTKVTKVAYGHEMMGESEIMSKAGFHCRYLA